MIQTMPEMVIPNRLQRAMNHMMKALDRNFLRQKLSSRFSFVSFLINDIPPIRTSNRKHDKLKMNIDPLIFLFFNVIPALFLHFCY